MKNILLFLAILSVLSVSCSKRWCYTHYPPSSDSIRIETVRDSIIYKDTTIFIDIPGKTVTDSVEIPCPDPGPAYIPKRVYAETSLAKASAWFAYPVIKLELVQKDTTIVKRLEAAIKEAYHWKSEYLKITIVPEPVKFIPKFHKFCTWAFCLLCVGGIAYGIIKFKVYKLFKFK